MEGRPRCGPRGRREQRGELAAARVRPAAGCALARAPAARACDPADQALPAADLADVRRALPLLPVLLRVRRPGDERYGILRGVVLAGWRLLRCNPWSPGGVDLIDDQRLFKPRSTSSGR